jgi:hypothetical protein
LFVEFFVFEALQRRWEDLFIEKNKLIACIVLCIFALLPGRCRFSTGPEMLGEFGEGSKNENSVAEHYTTLQYPHQKHQGNALQDPPNVGAAADIRWQSL